MNSIYKLAKSVLFRFTPEQAHHIILSNLDWATQLGAQKLVTRSFPENPIEIMGLRFPNCVGLAAGMDKTASMSQPSALWVSVPLKSVP